MSPADRSAPASAPRGTGGDSAPDTADTIDELRAQIAELREVVTDQAAQLARLHTDPPAGPDTTPDPPATTGSALSRRTLFGLAGAGIAGVAAVGSASPAAAALGDPLTAGGATVTTGTTTLSSTTTGTGPAFAVSVLDTSGTGPAIAASHFGDGPGIGVATSAGGPGVDVAHFGSGAGVRVVVSSATDAPGLSSSVEHTDNDAPAVEASTAGGGPAVRATVTDDASFTPAVEVIHPGDADAVSISAPAGTGLLSTSGTGTAMIGRSTSGTGAIASSTSGDGLHADSGTASAIVAVGGRYGATLSGAMAALRLVPTGSSGAPKTGTHERGELLVDSAGTLWLCRTRGTPGTWARIPTPLPEPEADPDPVVGSVVQILLDAPQRAYDSRDGKAPTSATSGAKGTLLPGRTRRVWLAEATDIPGTASAVVANVTVVNTSRTGYLAAFKAGVGRPNASTINWDHPDSIVANAVTIACNGQQQIDVFCSGADGGTDFLVDVIGYYQPA